MASSVDQSAEPPSSVANIAPPDVAGSGQTRLLIKAIEDTVGDLKSDVRDMRNYRLTDLLLHLGIFTSGFLILAGMMIYAYFKIEEKSHALSISTTRVEQKLDDLIARVPPVQAPIPRR